MVARYNTDDWEEDEPQKDTEITLGPAMLLGILCGLVLLCGLCYGLGYMSGHRSAMRTAAAATAPAPGQPAASSDAGLSKPQAKGTVPVAVPQPAAAAPLQTMPGDASPAQPNALTSYAPATSASSPSTGQQQVHPALPVQTAPAGSTSPVAQQPAAPAAGIMVQVAAVSHAEDATVLMNALRKRGYAVMERRGFSDDLIHVQIGPFANRNDAVAMSQKLLGDGYNAVVLP